ncbi:hypothetical protein KEM56_000568 [Ascosphaera pollenicola]|nr:hypothetical protein KEM56_000568 [Ascosphaera pollenicola]
MASSSTALVLNSKGHLSCYFKLQVRSNQEPEAAKLLADYDTWYQEQSLAVLLADRMRAKRSQREKNDYINKRNSALSFSSSVVDTPEVRVKIEVEAAAPHP